MSELQSQATTGILPAPRTAPSPAPEKPSASYWQIVGHAFFRRILHRIATGYVIVLAILAVIVPFLANGRPFVVTVDGQRRYPLFQTLTSIDLIIFIATFAVLIFAITYFFTRRTSPDRRSSIRRWAFFSLIGLTVISSTAVALTHKQYNDLLRREDYKGLTPDYEVKDAIFPPVNWGFDDAVYPATADSLFQDPSHEHPLGTDGSGRDTVSRLLWSARIVFGIGLVSEFISLFIGIIYGAFMGYFGGAVDILGSRFIELVESIPTLFLIITFVALFGRDILIIMVIIGITGWTGIARFVRAEFLRLRNQDYVTAARAAGLPLRSILFRHILPNGLTPVLVNATFGIAGAITLESGLSFLGLGVEPPTPSWGSMLNEAGNPADIFHFWLAFAPGMLIFLTIFAYNIIGEGIRDALDPRLNRIQ